MIAPMLQLMPEVPEVPEVLAVLVEAARTVGVLIPLVPLPVPASMRWGWPPRGCLMASATP